MTPINQFIFLQTSGENTKAVALPGHWYGPDIVLNQRVAKLRGGSTYGPNRHRTPPFWKINHANSAYFRLFLGYFGVISAIRPPFWILAPPLFTYPGSAPAKLGVKVITVGLGTLKGASHSHPKNPALAYMCFDQLLWHNIICNQVAYKFHMIATEWHSKFVTWCFYTVTQVSSSLLKTLTISKYEVCLPSSGVITEIDAPFFSLQE